MEGNCDNSLVRAAADGDDRAFEILVDRYQEKVAGFIWRVVGPNDIEDVCQDIFIKTYLRLKQFRFDARFSTWLFSIAWRTAISHQRKRGPEQPLNRELEDDTTEGLDSAMADAQFHRLLEEEIQRLTVDQRAIVTLFHMQEFSIDQIGDIMGRPPGTIKSLLFRTRRHLKQQLESALTTP